MALTVTDRGEAWTTTAGNKTVTFTPAVGDVIVVFCANSGRTTAQAPTVTDNNSSGTYTKVGSDMTKNTSADSGWWFIRDTPIASATSTIVTMTQSSDTGGGMQVWTVGPMNAGGSSLVGAKGKQDNQAAATPSITLDATPLSTSAIFGAVFTTTNGSANSAPPTSFTEATDIGYNTPASGLEAVHRASGHTSTTVAWTAATPSAFGSSAIEVKAAQSLTPTFINQTAVINAPTVSSLATIVAGLISQAAATFAPTITQAAPSQGVTLALIDRTATATAPTVTPGAVNVTLGLINQTAAINAPSVSLRVDVGLINQTAVINAPTVTSLATISAGLITRTATATAPTVTSLATASLGLIDRTATATAPTISVGPAALTFGLINQAAATFTPTVTPGAVNVTLGLINQTAAASSPAVSLRVDLGRVDQTAVAVAPTITTGSVNVDLDLIDRTAATFAAEVAPGAVSVSAGLIDRTAAIHAATVSSANAIALALLDRTAIASAPAVTSLYRVTLGLIDQTATVTAPTVIIPQFADLGLINQAAVIHAPTVTSGAGNVVLDTIDRTATPFAPSFATFNTISLPRIVQTGPSQTGPLDPVVTSVAYIDIGLIDQAAALFSPSVGVTLDQALDLPFIDQSGVVRPISVFREGDFVGYSYGVVIG